MEKKPTILTINTGSTTTKVAVFEGEKPILIQKFEHTVTELDKLKTFDEQVDFRKSLIEVFLQKQNLPISDIDMMMCRGGLIKPVPSGVYEVNDQMIQDLKNAPKQHASNLAAVIGKALSGGQKPVYIADPVVVDEMQDLARYSGHKLFERKSIFHALNHKAVARKYADEIGKKYEDLNLIIAHLGGGISVGAHLKGKVVDVNQALDGEGPFSPERSGTLPAGDLIKTAFSGQYTWQDMKQMLVGKGGLVSYLGTNNVQQIEEHLTEDSQKVLEAMAYQVSKSIGEMAVVLNGEIDAIILTEGVAYSSFITSKIKDKVKFLAPVVLYPGEDEMKALAYNGLLVYRKLLFPEEYIYRKLPI
jgi:butyrate kinase